MEIRRETLRAAIKLAVALSAAAVAVVLGFGTVGGTHRTALVLTVMVVGFVASWVQTDRVARSTTHRTSHRLTVVPLRQPVG